MDRWVAKQCREHMCAMVQRFCGNMRTCSRWVCPASSRGATGTAGYDWCCSLRTGYKPYGSSSSQWGSAAVAVRVQGCVTLVQAEYVVVHHSPLPPAVRRWGSVPASSSVAVSGRRYINSASTAACAL